MRWLPVGAESRCSLLFRWHLSLLSHPSHLPHPVPARLQRQELHAFVHFGPNTFSGAEWGNGREDPKAFNPTDFDARQRVRTFKQAGFTGVIITAKHHDGFCLWPTRTRRTAWKASPWRNGDGDMLREVSEACRAEGLGFGVYLSPWDRNHPTYGTRSTTACSTTCWSEVLGHYGPIFEVWFDGANGEGRMARRQDYDWPLFISTVRRLQPRAVIFSDAGPDVRWVGNERGEAPLTVWSMIDRHRYYPGTPLSDELGEGTQFGENWVPAECDVSIRPGWFYRSSEDTTGQVGLDPAGSLRAIRWAQLHPAAQRAARSPRPARRAGRDRARRLPPRTRRHVWSRPHGRNEGHGIIRAVRRDGQQRARRGCRLLLGAVRSAAGDVDARAGVAPPLSTASSCRRPSRSASASAPSSSRPRPPRAGSASPRARPSVTSESSPCR